MGGGNRKKFTKSKSRRGPKSSSSRALFVEGGLLDDWSFPFSSPNTRGNNLIDENGIGSSRTSKPRNVKGRTELDDRSSPFSSPTTRGNNLIGGNRIGPSSTSKPRNRKGRTELDPSSRPGYVSDLRNGSKKSTGSAIGYVYPSYDSQGEKIRNRNDEGGRNRDERRIIILGDSSDGTPIVAYMDEGPVKGIQSTESVNTDNNSSTLYDCSQYGLGFCDNMDENPTNLGQTPTEEQNEYPTFESSDSDEYEINNVDHEILSYTPPDKNPGFLSIGGMKIYTQDLESDEEESKYEENSDSASESDSDESSDGENSDSGSSTGSSDRDMFESGSDIDDEVAADYFECIRDSDDNTVHTDRLLTRTPTRDSFNETLGKLGGISLGEASREYGRKKPQSGSKSSTEDRRLASAKNFSSSPFDGMMLIKDPRTFSKKKNHVAKISKSWPLEAQKSKIERNFPGEKKKHRKERIAQKRRDRLLRRGVDLQEINLTMQQIVLDGVEIFSFPRMHSSDCSQVRKLATVYRMKSSCQGSGKKRFVTVVPSQDTCMPSPSDMIRIEKFTGAHEEEPIINNLNIKQSRKAKCNDVMKTVKGVNSSLQKFSSDLLKKKRSGKSVSYAAQPVSFISKGIMDSGALEVNKVESSDKSSHPCGDDDKKEGVYGSQKYGAFELHTTGFGSKMLAKMGYVEGGGLGKDGQGVAKPVEVFQRPKSLGLGADDVYEQERGKSARIDASKPIGSGLDSSRIMRNNIVSTTRGEIEHVGSFEKHTKGVGSKIMAKMGFVEGMGLGKDSQGMVMPLVAVRRPKARGLGSKV